ncbi:hypothetical protein EYF80_022265 [Liparis tanakae]|uniref:Uncharacterized protein n=1 Tax=Liparis tanakae TaxID=230148 RepID=A0A4Z2HNQ5_9TELE|nr:hypothetical protein EYF80_022265 [Liparis tanakae]
MSSSGGVGGDGETNFKPKPNHWAKYDPKANLTSDIKQNQLIQQQQQQQTAGPWAVGPRGLQHSLALQRLPQETPADLSTPPFKGERPLALPSGRDGISDSALLGFLDRQEGCRVLGTPRYQRSAKLAQTGDSSTAMRLETGDALQDAAA